MKRIAGSSIKFWEVIDELWEIAQQFFPRGNGKQEKCTSRSPERTENLSPHVKFST